MSFNQTFYEFLNQIITDYRGQKPDLDTAKGTLVFIKSACIASALWGLSNQQKETAKKPFPDQCNLDDLKHWAQIKNVLNIDSYISGDGSYTALVAEVLSRFQNPGGGGNKYDWERWSKECSYDHGSYVESVIKVKPWENKRGEGSVDVVIVSDRTDVEGGEQEPTDELIAAATTHLESLRSLGIASDFVVYKATKVLQGVSMSLSDGEVAVTDALLASVASDIVDYMKSMIPGATLYRAQLEAFAIDRGVNVESITPDTNVSVTCGPDTYERIWPDTGNISIVKA